MAHKGDFYNTGALEHPDGVFEWRKTFEIEGVDAMDTIMFNLYHFGDDDSIIIGTFETTISKIYSEGDGMGPQEQ